MRTPSRPCGSPKRALRVQEARNLRLTDIDSTEMRLLIQDGKGGSSRYVMLVPLPSAEVTGPHNFGEPDGSFTPASASAPECRANSISSKQRSTASTVIGILVSRFNQ